MKKLFFILTFIAVAPLYSQFITVTPSNASQMTQAIINPRCITVSGTPVIVSGANFAGNPNSVGRFSAGAGSTFPIANGIVLSTGALNKVPGPKDLPNYAGEGTTSWPGDADMNAKVGQSNFVNASSLEFNFTSSKPNFKFNFLFSSEEYGSFQCNPLSDDTMVILLTDLTDNSTVNIAATPSVISVNNIRRNVNNTTCADSNPSFFGTIYNNASGPTAPINFLGSTIPMSATYSLLVPGRAYKLKIVIADKSSTGYDSAVFIGNYIDEVQATTTLLGPDLVGNLSVCGGTPTTLTANVAVPTSLIRWRKNGVILAGENALTLNISAAEATGNNTYTFTYLTNTCGNFDGQSDSIVVNFLPPTITPDPITLNKCSSGNYNLAENTSVISAGLSFVPIVTYHTDAACATPALPANYTGAATTIYALIAKPGTPACPIIKSFSLGVVNDPFALPAGPQQGCSTIVNGPVSFFNVNALTATILGATQPSSVYGVSYHSSQQGAQNNTNLFGTSGGGAFINFPTGPVFVRVYVKGNQNCFDASQSFVFTVNPRLPIDKPADIVYCGTQFILPPLTNGRYFDKPYVAGDPTSQLPELFAGDIITSSSGITNSRTIYVSVLKDANGFPCSEPEWPLKITFVKPDQFRVPVTVLECDKYTLPAPDYGNYYTGPNGTGTIITEVVNNTNATTTTQVYYYFQSSAAYAPLNPQCTVTQPAGPATVTLERQPDLGPARPNVFTCNPPYVLPSLSFEGFPNAKYYNGPDGTLGEITDLNINPSAPGVPTTKEIFIYEEGTGTLKCPAERSFKVFIGLEKPVFPPSCNLILPDLSPGQYWTGPNGTGNQLFAGQSVIDSGTYYLYVPYSGPPCTAPFTNETDFNITVSNPPIDQIQFQALGVDGNPEKDINNIDIVQTANAYFSPTNVVNISCGPVTLKPIANGKYYTESQLGGTNAGTQLFPNDNITATPGSPTTSVFVYTPPFTGLTCDIEIEYRFTILDKPIVADIIGKYEGCQNVAYQLPTLGTGLGEYYNVQGGPSAGGVPLSTTEQLIASPFTGRFYIYKANPTNPTCFTEKTLDIELNNAVTIQPFPKPIEEHCSTFTLPAITAGKYYDVSNLGTLTDPSATALTNLNITIPSAATSPYIDKTYYNYDATYRSDGSRLCFDEESFRLLLYKQPTINPIPDQYFCGPTPVTGADLQAIAGANLAVPTDLVTAAKYYTKSHLTDNGGVEITPTTVLTNGQIVYAYAKNPSIIPGSTFSGCADEKSFKVNIFRVDVLSVTPEGCGNIALAALPTLSVGNYFTSPNGVNPLTAADLVNTSTTLLTKTIYIYGSSGFITGCQSDQSQFTVEITPIPVTNPVLLADRTFCDDYQENDGFYLVENLNQFDATIKGVQTSPEFTVTYHETEPAALLSTNNNPIIFTTLSSVYAVVRNSNFPNCSSPPYKIDFFINLRPTPTLEDKFICVDNFTFLPAIGDSVTLDTNLPLAGNTFVWYDSAGIITTETSNVLITSNDGIYSVEVTNSLGCTSDRISAEVIASSKAIATYTVTQNFEDNQTIVVIANGAPGSVYEYQLDGAPFQDSNIFENLSSGYHTIIVRDKNGCGDSDPIEALIINYPKYFTPNGDGIHDTWNIFGLAENQQNAKITIYDRHGKLLKQISPSGLGWDGKYNGAELPSSDYWFTVRYLEDGLTKEFKSHFSMKR
jgi:gliding motility-associated-like protein